MIAAAIQSTSHQLCRLAKCDELLQESCYQKARITIQFQRGALSRTANEKLAKSVGMTAAKDGVSQIWSSTLPRLHHNSAGR
jgi:hypothetical protein